ncbi:ribonuclease H-like domain-containing protein [Tanacetum coccineum]|uniref:Ribonuclease H-like domain-containing protein n=1 Tax=Tanacetum coccineum TaxID=301880 RepID=A0ABQ5BKC3_9ASTR
MVTVRCLLNIVVSNSWHMFQLDVNNAFLYGDLDEVVYMKPPEGYFPSDYKSKSDYSLYIKSDKGVFLALLVYVDDIIIMVIVFSEMKSVKLSISICIIKGNIVSWNLLSEYGMLACKPVKTPLMSKLVISNEASDKDSLLENITDYQNSMGKLIYLTNTMPDISYVVHCLSQFMHSPLTSHLKIAFKILRYLKSCPGLGIHINKTSVPVPSDTVATPPNTSAFEHMASTGHLNETEKRTIERAKTLKRMIFLTHPQEHKKNDNIK